jgi:transcriptional regulator with XRE-family HTH domain
MGLDLLIQCFLEFPSMNTPTMQTIENIKEKAEKAGYTITDVARHAGFDPSQVSRYVTGKTIPLVTSIQRLEESVDSLIQQRLRALNRAERAEE